MASEYALIQDELQLYWEDIQIMEPGPERKEAVNYEQLHWGQQVGCLLRRVEYGHQRHGEVCKRP